MRSIYFWFGVCMLILAVISIINGYKEEAFKQILLTSIMFLRDEIYEIKEILKAKYSQSNKEG